jgi:serine/threonine protein kinase
MYPTNRIGALGKSSRSLREHSSARPKVSFRAQYDLLYLNALTELSAKQLPEPFLWIVFRELAEALHHMHTGLTVASNQPTDRDRNKTNNQLPRKKSWRSVVNTDIKPQNVVLSHARDDYYPSYKTPSMIDFGLAFNDNRYKNTASKKLPGPRASYQSIGTRGFPPSVRSSHILLRTHEVAAY